MNPSDTSFTPKAESSHNLNIEEMTPTLEYVEHESITQEYDDNSTESKSLSSIEDKIQYAVFKSINFTSKFVNQCELSGEKYNNSKLVIERLNCAEQINNHHCYGCIQYHPDNENLMNIANMYFECAMDILCNHSWKGLNIKIERSNGDIMDTNIHENSCIRYLRNQIMFYIEFHENNELLHKWIPLTDYYSERRNKTDRGILSLNPDFYQKEIILYINNHPKWMNTIRESLIELFITEIEKTGIKVKLEYK